MTRRPTRCAYCGKRLPAPKSSGRPKQFCNPAHKAKAYRGRIRQLLAGIRA